MTIKNKRHLARDDNQKEECMTEQTYNVILPEKGVPIKAWTKGVPLEDAARQQLLQLALSLADRTL